MAMIYVRARPGRRAFYEGKVIPEDKFIPVNNTSQVRRMIDHWGDLEEQGKEKAPSRRKATPKEEPTQ